MKIHNPTRARGTGAWRCFVREAAWHPSHRASEPQEQNILGRWWVFRPLRSPRTASQESLCRQPTTSEGAVLADDLLGEAAAGRAKPALAARNHAVADDLIRMNGRNEQPTAELVFGRAKEIDSQQEKKHDGDETSSPPSTFSIRVGVRTCRQTR